MSYLKAKEILPEHLLKEIQKYVQGKYIYIPNSSGVRKKWGENSGYKNYLKNRNKEIRERFFLGVTIDYLAEEFCLSVDSIKKIVYKRT